jgi:hypothetical protein
LIVMVATAPSRSRSTLSVMAASSSPGAAPSQRPAQLSMNRDAGGKFAGRDGRQTCVLALGGDHPPGPAVLAGGLRLRWLWGDHPRGGPSWPAACASVGFGGRPPLGAGRPGRRPAPPLALGGDHPPGPAVLAGGLRLRWLWGETPGGRSFRSALVPPWAVGGPTLGFNPLQAGGSVPPLGGGACGSGAASAVVRGTAEVGLLSLAGRTVGRIRVVAGLDGRAGLDGSRSGAAADGDGPGWGSPWLSTAAGQVGAAGQPPPAGKVGFRTARWEADHYHSPS